MALTSLNVTIKQSFDHNVGIAAATRSDNRLADFSDTNSKAVKTTLSFGTGNLGADQLFQDSRSLSSSASEDLNISGGAHSGAVAMKNPAGETISFSKIKAILIHNTSAAAAITVGGETTNGFTALFGANEDTIRIPAGGCLCLSAIEDGWAVASNEVLQITNESGAAGATYEIKIAGVE